jgi:hypothetical protein
MTMTMTTLPDYVTPAYLGALSLRAINGTGEVGDRCAIQEIRAWRGLSTRGYGRPDDVCPVLYHMVLKLQTVFGAVGEDRRCRIALLLPTLADTADHAVTLRRVYRCLDWACREALPPVVERLGYGAQAEVLRGLPPIIDGDSARVAAGAARAAARVMDDMAAWPEVEAVQDRIVRVTAAIAVSMAAERAEEAVRDWAEVERVAPWPAAGAVEAAERAARAVGRGLDPIALLEELIAMRPDGRS